MLAARRTHQTQDDEDTEDSSGSEASMSPPTAFLGLSDALLHGYVGNFYRVMEEASTALQDVELALPQIVVVGQESSGKSSVLESLAMLPLFPRREELCTRLPIHLKLRHVRPRDVVDGDPELMPHRGSGDSGHQIKLRLVYADGRQPVVADRSFTAEEAAEKMSEWIDTIVREEEAEKQLKGVVEHVLEMEVSSPLVPNLNLIDLPGIVAGRLSGEPEDMMQRTRALVEKYLQMPHTLVLAVVPAFERVRNSQALQLVQQFNLMDSTIGVLTMVDRALDSSNPDGPLAEIMRRLDGTSRDIVELKQGYVAVKNRDTRVTPERSLGECKREENSWLEGNLPGYIERGLASSSVLVTKLEKMLADHVRTSWVPQTLANVKHEQLKIKAKLSDLGPDGQEIVDGFQSEKTAKRGRQRVLELLRPILPSVLSSVDEEIMQLAVLIHADFLKSRDEHELLMAPFNSKQKLSPGQTSGSLMAASLLVLDSMREYMASHLSQIVRNVALRVVSLVQSTVLSPPAEKDGAIPLHIERFANLHCFFASVIWEKLNELLLDDDTLLGHVGTSFLEFDPSKTEVLHIPEKIHTQTSWTHVNGMKDLAKSLEKFLHLNGFQNVELGELYLPPLEPTEKAGAEVNWSADASLDSDVARLVISALVPTLPKGKLNEETNPKTPQSSGWRFGTPRDDQEAVPAPMAFYSFGAASPPVPMPNGGFGGLDGAQTPGFGGGFGEAPKKEKPRRPDYQDVGEFESRLFFALTTHVVAPLLQPICDVSELDRKMRDYVARQPTVSDSPFHIFWDATSIERKKLLKLAKHLDAASQGLQSMANYQ